jgi:hypothetical protein
LIIVRGAGLTARRRAGALLTTLAVSAVMVASGCSSHAPVAEPAYGSLPTYLPSSAIQPDRELVGTVDKPALTTEGDGVMVKLAEAGVRVTVTGPDVPGEGLPYQAPSTTCTWQVRMTAASAVVPIRLGDFSTLDHLGTVYAISPVAGQPALPARIGPGQTVSFDLQAVMRVGEGLMRWAPGRTATSSPQIVASWDFEVEND